MSDGWSEVLFFFSLPTDSFCSVFIYGYLTDAQGPSEQNKLQTARLGAMENPRHHVRNNLSGFFAIIAKIQLCMFKNERA